jgi:S-methylmethionine-dependent homocysteine/selenocysteine methylase
MALYRDALPQLSGRPFLADGGIETTLIFHLGFELPHFAAFPLLATVEGRAALATYFRTYLDLATRFGTGLVLESPTWRANPDWGARLGYGDDALAAANREGIRLLTELRGGYAATGLPVVASGCVGPRDDGYAPATCMAPGEAHDYHQAQLRAFADAGADMACGITMTHAGEAIGIAHAARDAGLPVAISFTVETDGRLPTGQPLAEAIDEVDAATAGQPAYYMVNCAHPTHFIDCLEQEAPSARRIRGVRANASRMSHAELNEAPDLDAGDPVDLARQYVALKLRVPTLNVLGGCCGTDHRHIAQIAAACLPLFDPATRVAAPSEPPSPRGDAA